MKGTKYGKRALSLLLVLVLVLGMFPGSVFADETGAASETDPQVAEVQAMIDALVIPDIEEYTGEESEEAYESALADLEADLEVVYEAIADLSEEQAMELTEEDVAVLDAAKEAIHTYRLENLPMATAAGTQADPHVYTIGAGLTQTDGKSLYTWITKTVGWSTDKHFYAEPVNGGSRIEFTTATGFDATGYFVSGKDVSVPVGDYKIIKVNKSGFPWGTSYTEAEAGYIRIEAASAEDADVVMKEGTTFDVPVNFFYELDAAEQNFVANVVAAACDTKEGYDPSKMVLKGYIDTLGIGWTEYMSSMGSKKNGDTERAQLYYDGSALGEFTIRFCESRPTVTIQNVVAPTKTFTYADKPEDAGVADVKALTTFDLSDENISKDLVTWSAANYHFSGFHVGSTEIVEGATADIEFTLKLADTADYIGSTATVTAKIRNITDVNGNDTHDPEEIQYTIRWMNGDTEVKSVESVSSEVTEVFVSYDGEAPTKASDENFNYYFSGWDTDGDTVKDIGLDDPIKVADANITVYAVYDVKDIYPVAYYDGVSETPLLSEKIEVGQATPVYDADPNTEGIQNPTREYYTFVKWDPTVAETVTEAATYTARWKANVDVNENNIADQEECFDITWKVEGQDDLVVPVKWGQIPAYDETVPAPINKTFAGWDVKPVAVTNDATYTAIFSNDTVYEIKFVVDEEYFELRYVNVTKDETTATDWTPEDKANLIFDGWYNGDVKYDFTAEVKSNLTLTAGWVADTFDNNVRDEDETAYVRVNITGNGTVALSSTTAEITGGEDGLYTVLYNSTVEGGNVVNVTATPKDVDGTDGSVDYQISAPESVTVTNGEIVTVEAVFGSVALVEKETVGNLYFNKHISGSSDISNLKNDVLTAVLNSAFNVDEYKVEIKLLGTWSDVTEDGWLNANVAAIQTALKTNDSLEFKITKLANSSIPAVSKAYTLNVLDSRPLPEVSVSQSEIKFEAKEEITTVVSEVMALFSITTTDPVTGAETAVQVSDSYVKWDKTYAWPADAETNIYTVTVQIPSNATYRESNSVSVTVAVTDTTIRYTVKYVDGLGSELLSEVVSENLATPTIANPTRQYYTFVSWTPAVAETVTENVTYTATWKADVDNNKNNIADQEETYTVVYVLGNGEADVVTENLAWGAETPSYDADFDVDGLQNPTREGYNFKNWSPAVAASIAAPAEGNTITYTATWSQKHVVTFMSNSVQYGEGIEVENEQLVAKPDDPTWDDDHDFLGWYNGETKYDFSTPVTASLTLTAKWRTDFNHNDIEDTTEAHYTITYDVDGVKTEHKDVLVNMPTPAYDADAAAEGNQPPAKANYKFNGWDPEVAATVTADVTYVAQWVNDVNNNKVDDAEETITLEVLVKTKATANTVTITGAKQLKDADGNLINQYVYDSTGDKQITIKAAPKTTGGVVTGEISGAYVSAILIDGAAAQFDYGDDYAVSYTFEATRSHTVKVQFTNVGFDYNEEGVLAYYPGMKNVKNEAVYNAAVTSPALAQGDTFTIQYLAREATSATVNLVNLVGDNDVLKRALSLMKLETITIDLPDLWRDVNVETDEGLIKDAVSLDQAASKYLTVDEIAGLWDVYKAAAGDSLLNVKDGLAAVQQKIDIITENIKNAAMYYEAHNFGYNPTAAETVKETIKVSYQSGGYYIEGETTITLKDLRNPSTVAGKNVSVMYRDYTDEDLVKLIGAYAADYETGDAINGAAVTCLDITDPYTFEGKVVSDTAYELTFKFAGNETYKPSEGKFTITVTKAGAKLDFPNVFKAYGESYTMLDPSYFTLDNEYGDAKELADSMIQFVIGLDINEVDINKDGVSGLEGKVQLILPEELQSLLDGILSATGGNVKDGVDLSLADLVKYLEPIQDTSVAFLKQALEAITSITETGNIVITLGGSLPTDVGAYLYGAVSTSSNYETCYDVGYIVIKPAATQYYLDWNYTDNNGVFSWGLLDNIDIGASAYSDAAFTQKSEEATAKVQSLFFGLDDEGKFVAELNTITDPEQLGNGAFLQMAYIPLAFGNQFDYTVPIVRPMVIIPNAVSVKFNDANNNNRFLRPFNNQPHPLTVTVTDREGQVLKPTNEELTITYTGLQTNTNPYGPTTVAPTHAGAYAVTAVYTQKDETGTATDIGGSVAVLVIEPAQATIAVEDKTQVVGSAVAFNDLVKATSAVNGLTPDTTVISAALAATGDFSKDAWEAVTGNVNVDFPAWLDTLLEQYVPGMLAGEMTPADFTSKVTDKVPSIMAKAQELADQNNLNVDLSGLEDILLNTLTEVQSVVDQLPDNVTLSFQDDASASNVGAYVVVGIVTDSDHYPAVDMGVLVIYPEATQTYLKFDYVDANGIWTQELLKHVSLTSSAYADANFATLAPDAAQTLVRDLFAGVDADGNLVLTYDQTTLTNGAYTQVSFIAPEAANNMYYAVPIVRPLVIVPNIVPVEVADVNAIYDGKGHGVDEIKVNGVAATEGVTVTYLGVGVDLKVTYGSEAPVHTGVYKAIVTYVGDDKENVGVAVADIKINQATATVAFEEPIQSVAYGGAYSTAVTTNPPDLSHVVMTAGVDEAKLGEVLNIIIAGGGSLANVAGAITSINIDFPEKIDNLLTELGLGGKITKIEDIQALTSLLREAMAKLNYENPEITALLDVLDQMNPQTPVSFEDNYQAADPGAYVLIAVVTSRNYKLPSDFEDIGIGVVMINEPVVKPNVTFQNITGTVNRAVIKVGGEVVDTLANLPAGEEFTVACNEACVVAYTTDGGKTYTKLSATLVEGNTYQFIAPEVTGDYQIAVIRRGDADENGAVDTNDGLLVSWYALNEFLVSNKLPKQFSDEATEIGTLGMIAADADISGVVDTNDGLLVSWFALNKFLVSNQLPKQFKDEVSMIYWY